MMQCICRKAIGQSGAYGFHKCDGCNRVYGLSEGGWSYHGFDYIPKEIDLPYVIKGETETTCLLKDVIGLIKNHELETAIINLESIIKDIEV